MEKYSREWWFNYFDNMTEAQREELRTQNNLPEDKKKEKYRKYNVEQLFNEYQAAKAPKQEVLSQGMDVASIPTSVVQEGLFGFGDEILGTLGGTGLTVRDLAKKPFVDDPDLQFNRESIFDRLGQNISDATDYYRATADAYREAAPVASTITDVGSAVGGGLGTVAALPTRVATSLSGKNIGTDLLKTAGLGGTGTATYQIGGAEGSLPERVNVLGDTGLAFGVGAVGSPLLRLPLAGINLGLRGASAGINRLKNFFSPETTVVPESRNVRDFLRPIIDERGGVLAVGGEVAEGNPLITQGEPGVLAYGLQTELAKDTGFGEQKASNIVRKYFKDNTDDVVTKAHKNIFDNLEASLDDIPMLPNENIVSYSKRVNQLNFDNTQAAYNAAQPNKTLSADATKAFNAWADDARIGTIVKDLDLKDNIELISEVPSLRPAFKIDKNGKITAADDVTIKEIETLRREFGEFYPIKGQKLLLKQNKEKALRNIIDDAEPNLVKARQAHQISKEVQDIEAQASSFFRANKVAEFEDYYATIMNNKDLALSTEERLAAFRRIAQLEISRGLQSNRNLRAYIKALGEEDSAKRRLFEIVYPNDKIDNVVADVDKANRFMISQAAFARGSDSIPKLASSIDLDALAAPIATLARKLTNRKLSNDELRRIAQILVSEDSNTIARLGDPAYETYFSSRIQQLLPGNILGTTTQEE